MKNLSKTLGTFLVYSYFVLIVSIVCKYIFHIQLSNDNMDHLYWINIIADVVFLLTASILNYDVFLKNDFDGDTLLSKILRFILRLFLVFIIFMAIKIGVSIVIYIITSLLGLSSQSNNQEIIEKIIKVHPIGMFLSVCVFAPIVEELIFRGSVRRVVTNDKLFVLTSGLLFGLIHVLQRNLPIIIVLITAYLINLIIQSTLDKKNKVLISIGTCIAMFTIMLLNFQFTSGDLIGLIKNISLSETINSLSYITMGLCLAYMYKRYNNIYLNIGVHALNNLFGYLVLIFTMINK